MDLLLEDKVNLMIEYLVADYEEMKEDAEWEEELAKDMQDKITAFSEFLRVNYSMYRHVKRNAHHGHDDDIMEDLEEIGADLFDLTYDFQIFKDDFTHLWQGLKKFIPRLECHFEQIEVYTCDVKLAKTLEEFEKILVPTMTVSWWSYDHPCCPIYLSTLEWDKMNLEGRLEEILATLGNLIPASAA